MLLQVTEKIINWLFQLISTSKSSEKAISVLEFIAHLDFSQSVLTPGFNQNEDHFNLIVVNIKRINILSKMIKSHSILILMELWNPKDSNMIKNTFGSIEAVFSQDTEIPSSPESHLLYSLLINCLKFKKRATNNPLKFPATTIFPILSQICGNNIVTLTNLNRWFQSKLSWHHNTGAWLLFAKAAVSENDVEEGVEWMK